MVRKAKEKTGPLLRTKRRNDGANSPVAPVPELNRLIHERMRLGIMSALAVHDSLSFQELKDVLQATDGNLSVHARKLEGAGYLECNKTFVGRMPKTEYSLSKTGRHELENYLGHMESLIEATRRP